jgi:hypothetical protein
MLHQRLDLALPHLRSRGIAVRQQDHGTLAVHLIVDFHSIAVEFGHGLPSGFCFKRNLAQELLAARAEKLDDLGASVARCR